MGSSDWDLRRNTMLIGARAIEHRDTEAWARFEDSFAQLPRTMAPRQIDYDRADAAMRFRDRQNEEADQTFPTPFGPLNEALLGGFARGDLVIVAGAGKVGKSMLLDQMLESMAGAGAQCRLYLSEMSPEKREARWVQRTLGVKMGRVLHKRLDAGEVDRVAGALDRFPWDATKANGKGFSELAELIVRHRPDVAAIDVLTKVKYDGHSELANGVVTLHAAAESVGAVLILATHLSRAGIDRQTGIRRPPTTDDIRDASQVADFADVVLLLHRQQVKEDGKATSNYSPKAQLFAPFVRTGEPVNMRLEFDSDTLAFQDPTAGVPSKTEVQTIAEEAFPG